MKKEKWQASNVPMAILALKLSEEAAEVGTEITDAHMDDPIGPRMTPERAKRLAQELQDTIFIAKTMLARVERQEW